MSPLFPYDTLCPPAAALLSAPRPASVLHSGPAPRQPRPSTRARPPRTAFQSPSRQPRPSIALIPSFQASPFPWSPRPPALVGPSSPPWPRPLPWYPPLTSPTGLASAFGPLVAASARPAAGLRAAGTPSAARWLPPAHGHPRVGLGRGCGLGVLIPSALAMTPPFSQAAASPPGTETLPLHGGALCGSR